MTKKIYRTFRKMSDEEQRKKFGFSATDLIKDEAWLVPPFNELFEHACLVVEDRIVEDIEKDLSHPKK